MTEQELTLVVNGQQSRVRVDPTTPLLFVLRNYLGLTGAKFGCGLEQCYACAVLVDGHAVTSCATEVRAFVGTEITSVEGLVASDGSLHRVQKAFVKEEAAQCGFCIPGMVIGAVALLERQAQPSAADVAEALSPHLCRCGSHPRIVKAVLRAARP